MSMLDVMQKRYSVRDFSSEKVSDDNISKIVEASLKAPTAHNNQPCRVRVIKSNTALSLLRKCTECHYNAPLAFIVSYIKDECWVRSYDSKNSGDVDAAIITTYMMLEAESLGLNTCWVMYFVPDMVRSMFNFKQHEVPVAILLVGYKSQSSLPSSLHVDKKPKSEIIKETD